MNAFHFEVKQMLIISTPQLGNLKLRNKIILSFLFVVLLPILLIGYFLVTRTTDTVLKQTNNINLINFQQIKGNISNQLNDYIHFADSIISEIQLMEYLNQTNDEQYSYFDKYQDYTKINNISTSKFSMLDGETLKVSIFTDNDTIIEDYKFIQRINPIIRNQDWYRKALEAKGANIFIGPYSNNDNIEVIGIVKLLVNLNDDKYTHVIRIEIPEKKIYSLMEKEAANKKIYLLDSHNKIMSATDRSSLGHLIHEIEELKEIPFTRTNTGRFELEHQKGMAFYGFLNEKNAIRDWKVVTVVSSEEMLSEIYEIVKYSVLICFSSFLVAILLVVVFSNKLTSRLESLVRSMSRVRGDKLEAIELSGHNDEIGAISRSFNSMMERINKLIQEVYVLDIKKKEAEINALQSQMNPHFLFNTMESIRMNLWKREDFETSEVVQKFSNLLRMSLDWTEYNIPLHDEIGLVRAYLEVQQYRYKGKLSYDIQIDKELLSYSIPKFILQPIVENAIYHGIEMKKGQGTVFIHASLSQDKLTILVKDDGIGMDAVKLASIQENLKADMGEEPLKGSVGIRNVHQRLRLHFGDSYGIEIESIKNVGTTVQISLPNLNEEERRIHV